MLTVLALVSAAPAARAAVATDPASGHSYEFVSTPLTWPAARAAADARVSGGVHGHLATLTSQAENDFVATHLGVSEVALAWIGGEQPVGSQEPDGGWSWITGEPFVYTNWASGEPNNDAGNVDGEESKLVLYFNHPLFGNGTWNDLNTNAAEPYVVEYDAPRTIQVGIDVKPGGSPNTINSTSNGKIPVAILSDATFNAPAAVDARSPTFGRTGDERSLAFCRGSEDVNGDRRPDLVCHFDTAASGFRPGDTRGNLKARTKAGAPIAGSDSVRIVK